MFKTTVTAWLVRLAITWVGAGVIAFLVSDYVLRENVEAVGTAVSPVATGIGALEEAVAAQAAEIAGLKAAVEAAGAEADTVPEVDAEADAEAETGAEDEAEGAPDAGAVPAEETVPEGGSN